MNEEELDAVMSDQDKLKLGNELIRLRDTEAGFKKNYHMTDFEEFFRVVGNIENFQDLGQKLGIEKLPEKLPQSKDAPEVRAAALEDAFKFARSKQNGPMNEEKPEDREARIDRAIADARKKGHIGKAFDVRQNRSFFDQDPERLKRHAAMRDRVARLRAKKAKGEQ